MPSLNLTQQQQRYHSDCLSTCALMVLAYLGIRVRYRRPINLLGIQKDIGASIYNLSRLTSLGVTVDIQEGDMELLHSLIENGHPVVVAVNTIDLPDWNESTTHSVVVTGINDLTVFYHDPWFADGPKSVDKRKFESAWLYREYLYAIIRSST